MTIRDRIKSLGLTWNLVVVSSKAEIIGKQIGDLPLSFFPERVKELLELAEIEMDLEDQLYDLYSEAGEDDRAERIEEAMKATRQSYVMLKEIKYYS